MTVVEQAAMAPTSLVLPPSAWVETRVVTDSLTRWVDRTGSATTNPNFELLCWPGDQPPSALRFAIRSQGMAVCYLSGPYRGADRSDADARTSARWWLYNTHATGSREIQIIPIRDSEVAAFAMARPGYCDLSINGQFLIGNDEVVSLLAPNPDAKFRMFTHCGKQPAFTPGNAQVFLSFGGTAPAAGQGAVCLNTVGDTFSMSGDALWPGRVRATASAANVGVDGGGSEVSLWVVEGV